MNSVTETLNYSKGQTTLVIMTAVVLFFIYLDNRRLLAGAIAIVSGKDTTSGGGTSYDGKPAITQGTGNGNNGGITPVSGSLPSILGAP